MSLHCFGGNLFRGRAPVIIRVYLRNLAVSSATMANEAVLKYLLDTNRPYSCTDVTANLRGAYNKAAVQRALDALSESAQIRCKLYGKQKVYAAVQSDGDQKGGDDVGDLEQRTQALTKQLSEQTSALRSAEAALKALVSAPTTARAREQLAESRQRAQAMASKLAELKGATKAVSDEERTKILTQHAALLKEYKKRKNIATQMIDAILEGYPKSKKCLIEELCMETDEMVKFTPTSH